VIPAGTYIDVCMAGMGQRPDLWGSDVRAFNPDRFLSRYSADDVKAKFIPFSAGTRACIGERIARIEVLLTLVELLPRFRFAIAPEDDGLVEQTLSMHAKNEVFVHVSERAGAPASPAKGE
jgi:cytochrome P450